MTAKALLSRTAKIVLAQRDFWSFCKVREPGYYRESRTHLKYLCTILNNFYHRLPLDETGKIYTRIMINMPPQHGKTRTLINFSMWALGKNNEDRIISASYNDTLAYEFSKYTRDGIAVQKNQESEIVFSDIFPGTTIKKGSSSYDRWALTGQHFNYLGAGMCGSITGKGGTILLIDDPLKSAFEATNEAGLEKTWIWYNSTFLSRVTSEGVAKGGEPLEIICMTRWSKKDLCGRILSDPEQAGDWFVIKMEAYNETTGEMLCPEFMSKTRYLRNYSIARKNPIMLSIFRANYHQKPVDIAGRLYPKLKRYERLPTGNDGTILFDSIGAYIDTADEGNDYLACGIYLKFERIAYMLDIYYTRDAMEVTERETARRLFDFGVNIALVESNSGGRGFARAVKRILYEEFESRKTIVRWFHQSKNKISRITSESANVIENIIFPVDAESRWPEAMEHINSFQSNPPWEHDDVEDMITGIAERINRNLVEV
jgi:predicted phage terminase large subunit-like protein